MHAFLYTAIALLLLFPAGNGLCGLLFRVTKLHAAVEERKSRAQPPAETPSPPTTMHNPKVGGLIGNFERGLLAVGILAMSWEVLAAIVALKTVARFKELDERLDAEYFLVGSFFSLAWGIFVVSGWIYYDQVFGMKLSIDLLASISALKGPAG